MALFLVGCATFDQREISYLRSAGLPPVVVAKLERGKPLSPAEIIIATQRGVPDRFLIRHIDDNGVDYLLTREDAVRMRRGGVSAAVIDAVLEECEEFAREYAAPQVSVSTGFWWADSPYYGPDLYYHGW